MQLYYLAPLMGYLIGSISPGYFLGKFLKGIDIRNYRYKNTGASNTFRVVGKGPGVVAAIFDLVKGVLIILVLRRFGVPTAIAYWSGTLAVVGHIFPFYLNFKGGRGTATSIGLLFLFLIELSQYISAQVFLIPFLLWLVVFFITRDKIRNEGDIPYLIALPGLLIFIFLRSPLNLTTIFLGAILAFLIGQNIWYLRNDLRVKQTAKKANQLHLITWRTYLRPLAFLFPLIYLYSSQKLVLILTGALAVIFVAVDLFRLLFKKLNILLLNKLFIKPKEKKIFSSMSFFLVACFIIFLVFEKEIAILAVTFLIFGDLFAKFGHPLYGRIKFFNKTLEGAMAYFAGSLLVGYTLIYFLDFPTVILLVGAITASVTESLPLGVDDNFSVGLISGAVMQLVL